MMKFLENTFFPSKVHFGSGMRILGVSPVVQKSDLSLRTAESYSCCCAFFLWIFVFGCWTLKRGFLDFSCNSNAMYRFHQKLM